METPFNLGVFYEYMKQIEIDINFEKVKNFLKKKDDTEKALMSDILERKEDTYKKAGFRGIILQYNISEEDFNDKEFLYLTIDYIARVCWAFHSQGAIGFLKNYKQVFFDYKIGKILENIAMEKLFKYEREYGPMANGLVEVFGWCQKTYEEKEYNFSFWCDNLIVEKENLRKSKIKIIYTHNNDYTIRSLQNPIKLSFFNGLQFIEHIESLNLVISLLFDKMNKNDNKKIKKIIDILDYSLEYFINNKQALDTSKQSNIEVLNIIKDFDYDK